MTQEPPAVEGPSRPTHADGVRGAAGFPGGTGVSRLHLYPWPTADGCHGGSPHLHTVCTEAYVVVGGTGELRTLTPDGAATTPLAAGTIAWFAPGTVHRAVTHDDLQVVVVMQNSGLPEAGDAVLTFPDEILADPAAYRAAALDPADPGGSARRRRDLAVEGFLELEGRLDAIGPAALGSVYTLAAGPVAPRAAAWRTIVEQGPLQAATRTLAQIAALAAGDPRHLADADVRVRTVPTPADRDFGMCGRLDTYDLRDT